MPANGGSIKPLKGKLLAGEQKATEYSHVSFLVPDAMRRCWSLPPTTSRPGTVLQIPHKATQLELGGGCLKFGQENQLCNLSIVVGFLDLSWIHQKWLSLYPKVGEPQHWLLIGCLLWTHRQSLCLYLFVCVSLFCVCVSLCVSGCSLCVCRCVCVSAAHVAMLLCCFW